MQPSHKHPPQRLDYYLHDETALLRFQLSGNLSRGAAADVEQARRTAWSVVGSRGVRIDLTSVQTIDASGDELLREWHRGGARLIVSTPGAKRRIESLTTAPIALESTRIPGLPWRTARVAALVAAGLLLISLAVAEAAQWANAGMSAVR